MLTTIDIKQEWLECNDWGKKYNFVKKYLTSYRLKVLFDFNCVKSPEVYKQLTDQRSIDAIEIVEKYLDGKATQDEVRKAANAANAAWAAYTAYAADIAAVYAANAAAAYTAAYTASYAANAAANVASNQPEYQANILEKLLRPNWTFNPNWINETTKSLAVRINDEKRYDLSIILADALEDLGCDNLELLNYLRNIEKLIKGDWIIDCLMNRR